MQALVDEVRRIAALHDTEILDSIPERAFDDIARLASLICETPMAHVNFIDSERQWSKASVGSERGEVERALSFCSHTVQCNGPLVIPDATMDERVRNNPYVRGAAHIRSYAGAPITDQNGNVLGSVCVVDIAPRTLSRAQIEGLQILATQVVDLINLRKSSLAAKKATDAALSRTEQSLQRTAEQLHLAQAAGKVATWEWELASDTLTWGGGTEWVYGRLWTELSTIGELLAIIDPQDVPRVKVSLQSARLGVSDYDAEFRVPWPDGSVHWVRTSGKPVLSKGGKAVRIVGVHMDVTSRKAAEESLISSEKVAAVGRLASSIAHEINNPLASVTNLLFLARESEDPAEIRDFLALAQDELGRVSEITQQTLRFHRQAAEPQHVVPATVITGVLRLQQNRIRTTNIELVRRDRARLPVPCFEGEVRQVLANLIGNAIDAMSATGGRLLLRSREATDWRTGRHGVVIAVADSGPGMSREVVSRICTPFFTTKGTAGTGLGLWVTSDIIHRHEGRLRVRSRQSAHAHGTVFTVFLPS